MTEPPANDPTPAAQAEAASADASPDTMPASEAPNTGRTPTNLIADWPPNGVLNYNIEATQRGTPYYGKSKLRWQIGDQRYRIEQSTVLDLLITELRLQTSTSEGSVLPDGLAPDRYTEQRRNRATVATNFNREADKQTITFSSTPESEPLAPGAQDRASVLFQLAGLLRNQRDAGAVERVDLLLAGTRRAEAWTFVRAGEESVHTDAGDFDALRFVREPRPESYESRIEIWYAPAAQWYPVRIRYTERNGDVIDLTLDAYQIGDAP